MPLVFKTGTADGRNLLNFNKPLLVHRLTYAFAKPSAIPNSFAKLLWVRELFDLTALNNLRTIPGRTFLIMNCLKRLTIGSAEIIS